MPRQELQTQQFLDKINSDEIPFVVLRELFKIWKEQDYKGSEIDFVSFDNLAARLGWQINDENLKKLEESLRYLYSIFVVEKGRGFSPIYSLLGDKGVGMFSGLLKIAKYVNDGNIDAVKAIKKI
jgi:hypothetical protein